MPKIYYFIGHGRLGGIRLLMKHAGIQFEDVTVVYPGMQGDGPKWEEMKAANPERGSLPWYEDDEGKVYNQSMAIIRALARQAGYES